MTLPTIEALRLLVAALEMAEKVTSFAALPAEYPTNALEEGRQCLGEWERAIREEKEL